MRQTPDTTEARNEQEISHGEWQAIFQQFSQDPPGMVGVYRGARSSSTASHEANGLPFQALTLHLIA